MAHSLSAKKRVRQNERQKMVNRTRRSKVKSEVKKLDELLLAGNAEAAQAQFKLVTKKLDQVSSTSTMHKSLRPHRGRNPGWPSASTPSRAKPPDGIPGYGRDPFCVENRRRVDERDIDRTPFVCPDRVRCNSDGGSRWKR